MAYSFFFKVVGLFFLFIVYNCYITLNFAALQCQWPNGPFALINWLTVTSYNTIVHKSWPKHKINETACKFQKFITKWPRSRIRKNFENSVSIWRSYGQSYSEWHLFFTDRGQHFRFVFGATLYSYRPCYRSRPSVLPFALYLLKRVTFDLDLFHA